MSARIHRFTGILLLMLLLTSISALLFYTSSWAGSGTVFNGPSPGIYYADGYKSPGTIYRLDPATSLETTFYQRPSSRLTSFTLDRFPSELYFSYLNTRYIYKVTKTDTGWGNEEIVYTHTTYVRDLAFGPDGALYFSEAYGGRDGLIYRLEGNTATPYFTVHLAELGTGWRGDFTFDENGVLYLTSGNRRPGRIFRVENGQVRKIFESPDHVIAGIFVRNGKAYYTDWGQHIYVLDLATGQEQVLHTQHNARWLTDVYIVGDISAVPSPTPTPVSRLWLPVMVKHAR